ncbi:hypothetical protein NUM3379_10350 [Kineococcus sp. NUM-3379]
MSPHLIGRLLHTARRRSRAARARGERDLGASALEFAIIAAVVVVAASVIGGIIYNIVQAKSAQLQTCANQPIGAAACGTGAGAATGARP